MSKGSKITGAILILFIMLLPPAGYFLYKRAYYAEHFNDELNTFFKAAASNDVKALQKILSSGTPVDSGKQEGITALLVAANFGAKEAVVELLKHHPDLEVKASYSKKMTAWFSSRYIAANTSLPDIGASGDTALVLSVRTIRPDIEKLLLDAGAKVKGDAAVEKALIDAAQTAPNSGCLTPLLSKGLKFGTVQGTGQSLLHLAVSEGDSELARRALRDGVDIDHLDNSAQTALLVALKGHICDSDVLEILARGTHKLDALSRDLSSPLHEAVKGRYTKIVKILLERGAKPNQLDGSLQTPLLIAAKAGDIEICKLLMHYHADPSVRDSSGQSVTDVVKTIGYKELEKVVTAANK